jgi:hypothetical protein
MILLPLRNHHQQTLRPHEKPHRSSSRRSARNAQICPYTRALSSSSSRTRWESPSFRSFCLAPCAHLLSRGAFSNVYRAVEIATGKNVAGQFSPFLLCTTRSLYLPQSRPSANSSSMHPRSALRSESFPPFPLPYRTLIYYPALFLRAALLLAFSGRRQAFEPQVQEKAARYRGALSFNPTRTINLVYSNSSNFPQRANILKGPSYPFIFSSPPNSRPRGPNHDRNVPSFHSQTLFLLRVH